MSSSRAVAVLGAIMLLAACSSGGSRFSELPGFRAWYAAHPPDDRVPVAEDRALLDRFRPRIFVPEGSEGPISFYDDYIAEGFMRDGDGRPLPGPVTQERLNALKNRPEMVFVHRPSGAPARPLVLARVDREAVQFPGLAAPVPFTFLTYTIVFRTSGVLRGLPWWKRLPLELVGTPEDWHQLDHYTAATLALAAGAQGALEPVAVTLKQHNYMRTYLLGVAADCEAITPDADGRVALDAAIWSNELYPHRPGRTEHRAADAMTASTVGFLVSGEAPPFLSGLDVTEPGREVNYRLGFLPPSDAFYVFEGLLGETRWLPGRDGPPGADYNVVPPLKGRATQMLVFFWHENDQEYVELFRRSFATGFSAPSLLEPFARRFLRDWQRRQPWSRNDRPRPRT